MQNTTDQFTVFLKGKRHLLESVLRKILFFLRLTYYDITIMIRERLDNRQYYLTYEDLPLTASPEPSYPMKIRLKENSMQESLDIHFIG